MRIVIAFAQEDRLAKAEFEKHLFKFKDVIWDSSQIALGELEAEELKANYGQANYVIVLLSADFLSNEILMKQLRDLHYQKQTKILPVVFRPCLWQASDFAALKTIPSDHEPLIGGDDSKNDGRFLLAAREIYEFITGSRRSAEALPPLPKSIEPPKDPFLGSTWFKRSDAPVFFGRNQEIKALLELIEQNTTPVVAIFGQSGAGKSSLLEAGVLPRLEANWRIVYLRRDREKGIAAMLKAELDAAPTSTEQRLLILDQLEEMFTNPNPAFPDEKELFFQTVKTALETQADLKLIFGFRKEYYTDLKAYMKAQKLRWEDFPLEPLDRDDVLEAIEGVTLNKDLQWEYELEIEQGLAFKIASDILQDSSSNVAPFLQMQLRKMWDAVKDGATPRVFSEALYDQFRVASFDELLSAQLADLATDAAFSKAVHSGLVLDLLYFFTTETGTSAQRSQSELLEAYEGKPFIFELLEALKRRYLLTELQGSPASEAKGSTRLGHDALASLVVRHFNRSDAPGQQATRFLSSALSTRSPLTKEGLLAVQKGLAGRRKLSVEETPVYEAGLKVHYKSVARDLLGENEIEKALELLNELFQQQGEHSNLSALVAIQHQFSNVKRDQIRGTQSYDEIVRAFAQLRQEVLFLLRESDRTNRMVSWKKTISLLVEGGLEEALEETMRLTEAQGVPEWLDTAKMLASGYTAVKRDFRMGYSSTQNYLKFSSRALYDLDAFMKKMADTDGAYSELEKHFWAILPTAFASGKFLEADLVLSKQAYFQGPLVLTNDAQALRLSLYVDAQIQKLNHQGLLDFSELNLLQALLRLTLKNLCSGVFIGKTVALAYPEGQKANKENLLHCLKANDIDTFFHLISNTEGPIFEIATLEKIYAGVCFRYALFMEDYDTFRIESNKTIKALMEQQGLAANVPVPIDNNVDVISVFTEAYHKLMDGELGEALAKIEHAMPFVQDEALNSDVYLTTSRFEDISWRHKAGILSFQEYFLHTSRINAAAKYLIEERLPEKKTEPVPLHNDNLRLAIKALDKITVRDINEKLGEGKYEEALYMTEEMMLRLEENENINQVLLLQARWFANVRNFQVGVDTFDSYQIVCNQISASLLDIINRA